MLDEIAYFLSVIVSFVVVRVQILGKVRDGLWQGVKKAFFKKSFAECSFYNGLYDRAFPSYKAYETPVYFKSDWLNEFWDKRSDVSDDYRFVYMGPKGSWWGDMLDIDFSFRDFSKKITKVDKQC